MKEVLSQNNVKFAYVDVTSGLTQLKSFLKIRDHNDSHKEVRETGRVGVPTLLVDDTTYTVSDAQHAQSLVDELNLTAQ